MTTSTETRADTIGHLDFRPSCTCESGYCAHPDGTQCDAEADVILTFHQVHGCNTDGTDVYGNQTGPVCATCLDGMTAAVKAHVEKLRSVTQRFDPPCSR